LVTPVARSPLSYAHVVMRLSGAVSFVRFPFASYS